MTDTTLYYYKPNGALLGHALALVVLIVSIICYLNWKEAGVLVWGCSFFMAAPLLVLLPWAYYKKKDARLTVSESGLWFTTNLETREISWDDVAEVVIRRTGKGPPFLIEVKGAGVSSILIDQFKGMGEIEEEIRGRVYGPLVSDRQALFNYLSPVALLVMVPILFTFFEVGIALSPEHSLQYFMKVLYVLFSGVWLVLALRKAWSS